MQSPNNFVQSLLGHPVIGGGLIDFILISLLPLSLPVRGFNLAAQSLAIILIFYHTDHSQELANAFLAPAAFTLSPLQSLLLLISAITTRSRSAVAVIASAIITRSRSRFLKVIISVTSLLVILFECYQRYHYLSANTFFDAITTNRLLQWQKLPSSPVGIDGAITFINTVKFHNAFVDFRVISGGWLLSVWWLFLLLSAYQLLPLKILFSFLFIQFFWYNSIVVMFGWFFVMNSKNLQPNTSLNEFLNYNFNDDGIVTFRFFTQTYYDYQYIDDVGFDFYSDDFYDFSYRPYFEIQVFYGISQSYIESQMAKYPKYKKVIQEALEQFIPLSRYH